MLKSMAIFISGFPSKKKCTKAGAICANRSGKKRTGFKKP